MYVSWVHMGVWLFMERPLTPAYIDAWALTPLGVSMSECVYGWLVGCMRTCACFPAAVFIVQQVNYGQRGYMCIEVATRWAGLALHDRCHGCT